MRCRHSTWKILTMTNTTKTYIPTIVYVEDNVGDAVLLEEALRERNHATQLMVIDRGDKALRYFEIKATAGDLPPPHCILLDAQLPCVAGCQLLRFIRGSKIYDNTPVYIFSSTKGYEDLLAAGDISKHSFITKGNSWEGFLTLAVHLLRSPYRSSDVVRTIDGHVDEPVRPPSFQSGIHRRITACGEGSYCCESSDCCES